MPNVGCCGAGATMNSKLIQILEYWFMPAIHSQGVDKGLVTDRSALKFQRDSKLEIKI